MTNPSSPTVEPITDAMIEAGLRWLWRYGKPITEASALSELYTAMRSTAPQEPVADDDAKWLWDVLYGKPLMPVIGVSRERLERIATRLQAKAPMRIIPADPIVFEE